jgi:hypothetical protein
MTGRSLLDEAGRSRLKKVHMCDLISPVKDFIRSFRRDSAGHWVCIKPCEIDLPGGRIQVSIGTRVTVGTRFMDIDIAELLDQEYGNGSHSGVVSS